MNVPFWDVGALTSQNLRFTPNQVAAHIIADWVPNVPKTLGRSLLGWPASLLEAIEDQAGTRFLTLSETLRGSERQWKGVLSWMLGVAGARHALQELNYRWIAPCSAFYPNKQIHVDIKWPLRFPPGVLVIEKVVPPQSTLQPDYIALKPCRPGQTTDFCIAEAKGIDGPLDAIHTCPAKWRNQVNNSQVIIRGAAIPIPRRVVVATRVSPNAKRPMTRRIQVRAWNSSVQAEGIEVYDSLAIVVAHLSGMFRNLGYDDIARGLIDAHSLRHLIDALDRDEGSVASGREDVAEILGGRPYLIGLSNKVPELSSMRFGESEFTINISNATRELTQYLLDPFPNSHLASFVLPAIDKELDEWNKTEAQEGEARLQCGVSIRINS